MNIIPYLRFVWATTIVIRLFTDKSFDFDNSDILQNIIVIFGGLFTLTFTAYCVITGIQELKNREIIDAKYFDAFGLFVQIIVFLAGLVLLKLYFVQKFDLLTIGLLTFWQAGLLLLIIVDVRRFQHIWR